MAVCLVFILEMFFRFLFFRTSFLDKNYVLSDTWWKLNWMRWQGSDPDKPFFPAGEANYQPDRELGWNLKANLKNHRTGEDTLLSTNSRGVRGSREYPLERSGDTDRFVVLGDSFTFGDEVSDQETYSALLENREQNREVVNLGIIGYAHDQMLLKLKTEGVAYKPDLLILGFLGMDMERNMLSFKDYLKPSFELKDGQLMPKYSDIPGEKVFLRREKFKPKTFDFISLIGGRFFSGDRTLETDRLTAALLDEILKTAAGIRSDTLLVYLPAGPEISGDEASLGQDFFNRYCRQTVAKNQYNINCLDLRSRFREEAKKGVVFRGGQTEGHYDRQAHALVAVEIDEYLKGKGVLK